MCGKITNIPFEIDGPISAKVQDNSCIMYIGAPD